MIKFSRRLLLMLPFFRYFKVPKKPILWATTIFKEPLTVKSGQTLKVIYHVTKSEIVSETVILDEGNWDDNI